MNESHIVHIGLHKTASTWLQHSVFPHISGARYVNFDPVFKALSYQICWGDQIYGNAMVGALEDVGERILLSREAFAAGHPMGVTSADVIADRLARLLPGASILLVRRQPASLLDSLYSQYVKKGGHVSKDHFARHLVNHDYLDLRKIEERYRSRFQDVMVLDYEDLRRDPAEWLRQIEQFADVSLPVAPTDRSNVSINGGWRRETLRLWNKFFRTSSHNPNPPLPIRAPRGWRTGTS